MVDGDGVGLALARGGRSPAHLLSSSLSSEEGDAGFLRFVLVRGMMLAVEVCILPRGNMTGSLSLFSHQEGARHGWVALRWEYGT